MDPAVFETQPRSGHEVLDGARDEHLTRPGERRDSRTDRDRDPDHLAVADLALARMETGPHLETDVPQRIAKGGGGEDRLGGPIERGEEPIAGRVELPALEPRELATDDRVMLLKEVALGRVAELPRQLG